MSLRYYGDIELPPFDLYVEFFSVWKFSIEYQEWRACVHGLAMAICYSIIEGMKDRGVDFLFGYLGSLSALSNPSHTSCCSFHPFSASYTIMSKRKSSGNQSGNPTSLELDEEQIAALQEIPENLHPSLKCLVPVLEWIRKAHADAIPPHRRALPGSITHNTWSEDYTNLVADTSSYRFQAHYRCGESARC